MEQEARERVSATPELAAHQDIIFYDWSNWDEHMTWIATAPIAEIVSWAEATERAARESEE